MAMASAPTRTSPPNCGPQAQTFSIVHTAVRTIIAVTFMSPKDSMSAISAQQQPTQYSPWLIPTQKSRARPR